MKGWIANGWTTAAGILLLIQVAAEAILAQFDGVADTTPDWNKVVTVAIAAFGFLSARDASNKNKIE